MDRNSTLQASLEARGPIFCNQSIELYKLNNFCSICVKKMFTGKKLWIKMFKNFVEIFSSIFRPRRTSVPLERQNWKLNHGVDYMFSTNAENFSFLSVIVSEKKSGHRDPLKTRKNRDFSKPEVTSSKQKKVYQIFIFIYQSWKFHENRSKHSREILCTKSVRKIIRIIEKKKQ